MDLETRRSRAEQLARELLEFDANSPREIRQKVCATLKEAADADLGFYHSVVEIDGAVSLRDIEHDDANEERRSAGMEFLRNTPAEVLADFDFRRPPDGTLDTFSSPFAVWGREEIMKLRWFQYLMSRNAIVDEGVLMVFHGTALLGVTGAIWYQQKTYGPEDSAILQPLVKPVRAAVTAASCLARNGLPDEDAYLILRADGHIEQASIEARAWLERPGFKAALAVRVGEFDGRRDPTDSPLLEMAETRVVRIATDAGSRYLVCLKLAPQLHRRAAEMLTAIQLRIATAAAAGATAAEIARDLDRSTETVREHLDSIYHRLRVSTRVELARMLQQSPPVG